MNNDNPKEEEEEEESFDEDDFDDENSLNKHHLTTKFFTDALNKDLEIIFKDEEKISGNLQWFDRWNIKLLLPDGQECIIFRHAIKGYGRI